MSELASDSNTGSVPDPMSETVCILNLNLSEVGLFR
jgi:hypothetical protein